MAVPLVYSWRNLWTRRLTTALTAGGMALVIFVFAATLMLAEGLRQTLVATGSPGNVILLRKGSETEIQSGIERTSALALTAQPEIAQTPDARAMAAREAVVLLSLTKKSTGKASNVVIRGVEPASLPLRPQVRLIAGRLPKPGTPEIMVGQSLVKGFAGVGIGQALHFGKRDWPVVGIFSAGNSGFSSEIWGDVDQLLPAFGRRGFSVVVARLARGTNFDAFKQSIETNPRFQVEAWRESDYYEKQSKMMRAFLTVLGVSLTAIFSLGAMIGAMITMYAAVANRVPEIGALRAMGFSRGSILTAFLLEALLLGGVGGLAGIGLAAGLSFVTFSTTNFQTFSELAFRFAMTPKIIALSLGFSLLMGVVGGFLPAVRAARMTIVEALRQ